MDKASWLEVSLQVSPEQTEAIAEVLGRFTQGGVVVEHIAVDNPVPQTTFENNIKVFGYIFIDAQLENTKLKLEKALFYLGKIQPLPKPVYKIIQDQNWMSAWKDQYKPLKVGKKMSVLPAWADNNVFPDRLPIRINLGMAFGTGTHPTTQLCLEMMENKITPGMEILDIGCGSGILSIAAIKLGAGCAYGMDISTAAVKSSEENAELNNVQNEVSFSRGSVNEIAGGVFRISQAPLVLVNILATTIIRLFDDGLVDLITPGGTLILSGILSTQLAEIIEKSKSFGLTLQEQLHINDWVALGLHKSGV